MDDVQKIVTLHARRYINTDDANGRVPR